MNTKNEAEVLVDWYAGTLKLYQRHGRRYVKPYLLKPNELPAWRNAAITLRRIGFIPKGFGVEEATK